jgi:hypothetical protein
MARGFSKVAAARADSDKRKNSGGNFTKRLYFKLPGDGDTAKVRFLEAGEDVAGGYFHPVQFPDKKYPILIPCLDQDPLTAERVGRDCPGCEQELKRQFKGVINLIWRDAPLYATDDDGNVDYDEIVGYEDQVAVWQSGLETFEELQIQDETYGLDSRDFHVRRKGLKLATKYSINPVDGGPTELTKADKSLLEDKYDLDEILTPPEYEVWGVRTKKSQETEDQEPVRESPFAKARR